MSAAQVVSIDGFHRRQRELANLGLLDRKGTPETYDVAMLTEKMKEIRFSRGRASRAPGYSREIHDVVDDVVMISSEVEIVILEGNYLLVNDDSWRGVYELLDEVWYLEVDRDVVRQRLIDRHLRGGRTEEQAIWKTDFVDLKNYELIEQAKYRADFIIASEQGVDVAYSNRVSQNDDCQDIA